MSAEVQSLYQGSENYGPCVKSTYHLFWQIKFYWHIPTLMHLRIFYSCIMLRQHD